MFAILAILIMGLIIMIHEFGHFLVAKHFGVGIIEYSIGMGPMLFSYRKKDTVWSLRAFPIGGFCAMYGENSVEAEEQNKSQKVKTPIINRLTNTPTPEFKSDWLPEQSYNKKSKEKQIGILAAGPLANILTGIIFAIIYTLIFGGQVLPRISRVWEELPAEQAGIQVGDIVTKLEDRNILTMADYLLYDQTHKASQADGFNMTVKRLNKETNQYEEYTYFLTPNEDDLIGIQVETQLEQKPLHEIPKYITNQLIYWIRITTDSIRMLISGDIPISNVSGILGTTAMIDKTMQEANASENRFELLRIILIIIMFISINLGIMNLIPIPALDGGRILITWIEGAFEKNIPEKLQYGLNAISFGLLLCLMGYTIINDFIKIVMNQI